MKQSIDQKTENTADLLKALAHPVRLHILARLISQGAMNVSTLQCQINITQSLVSYHLIRMRNLGVLANKHEGRETYYFIADAALSNALLLVLNMQENKEKAKTSGFLLHLQEEQLVFINDWQHVG